MLPNVFMINVYMVLYCFCMWHSTSGVYTCPHSDSWTNICYRFIRASALFFFKLIYAMGEMLDSCIYDGMVHDLRRFLA